MTAQTPSGALRDLARSDPGRESCVDAERSVTVAELDRSVDAFAGGLEGLGVGPGSRLVLVLENSIRFVVAYLGAVRAGAVAVPLNPHAPPPAVLEAIRDAAPGAVVCAPQAVPDLTDGPGPERRGELLEGGAAVIPGPLPPGDDIASGPDDLAAIIYTSGTSGAPKGVMLTTGNMAAIAAAGSELLALRPGDRIGVVTPLFHLYGLREIDTALMAGSTLVVCANLTFPAAVLSQLHRERATGISGVPSAFHLMAERYRPQLEACAPHLRYLALGTDSASGDLLSSLHHALPGTRLLVTYGLTELSRACFRDVPTPDDRPGSVGRPYPGVELAVLDQRGRPAPAGEPGRVVLRSAMVSPGYWRRPDLTAQAMLDNGGLLAPDIGRVDNDGHLYLLGRVDDVVNTGGQKVGPDEVEVVLRRHPAIRDAAVTGVDDPAGILGRVLKAWVVPVEGTSPDAEEILRHCAAHLEPHKVPRVVELCERLPKSVLGKTSRARVGGSVQGQAPTTVAT